VVQYYYLVSSNANIAVIIVMRYAIKLNTIPERIPNIENMIVNIKRSNVLKIPSNLTCSLLDSEDSLQSNPKINNSSPIAAKHHTPDEFKNCRSIIQPSIKKRTPLL
jgi:hypothetical protein